MTDITDDCTIRKGVNGEILQLDITTPATAATGDVIDLGSDAAHGRGVVMSEIHNTLLQDDAGADKTCTWDPDTGIITLGTIVTGIHQLQVWGK